MKIICLLFFLILYTNIPANTISVEQNSNTEIKAQKTEEHIVIDGKLDENTWKRPGNTNLIQQDPEQGVYPTQRTEFWVAYDDEAFYFAARFYDTQPDSIMARISSP